MKQNKQIEKGIRELYQEDPIGADKKVFGRTSDPISRRGFLTGLATMSTILGAEIVFGRFMPAGLIPAAFAETTDNFMLPGKDPGLIVLNDRPINAEVPAHLLNDLVTPADKLFIRNNGIPPENVDVDSWTLVIDGESVETSKTYTIKDLKEKFESHTYQLTIECGGNGRAEFNPPAKGNQWTTGAVGSPQWTGVRLRDVLKDCGIKDDAVYIGYHGGDSHLSRNPEKEAISRGVPISKALEDEALIAWAMNGEDIPALNGHPLRLVFGGWPASTSGKWLKGISIRNKVHDGTKMEAPAYRIPCEPVAPGDKVAAEDMCIIEAMPVKSLVTLPQSGIKHKIGEKLAVKGHAWAGDKTVEKMDISIDFGQTWQEVKLAKPANKNAWQRWEGEVNFPKKGYYEVWAKATDSDGISQPMVLPGWNPKGYLNNACHRIAVQIV
ncbi:molybdopterin containing oxidoreductase [Photobacterium sanctipauli]|uniref:Molybdopterin containing oxidoreductase n=1 Tax=Photobacterium sanctipauli TaxID=1342794 RepID=A0A2T3NNB3_9GAMM|nr:sulfite oxidase [Photobacterium sanctipauli]PSW17204.1 molybdopterin containing oxidoreductase [Photobacterium sanctipauli]